MDEENQNGCVSFQPTLLQRIGFRLFPRAPFPKAPSVEELPFVPSDEIVTEVQVEISFLDRLRVLCSGRVGVDVRLIVKQGPEQLHGRSSFMVRPPKFMDL